MTALLRLTLLCLVSAAGAAGQTPAAAREAYERAIALEAAGNDAAALSLLWSAAGAAPADADIQQRLGEALERIGALDAAVDAYERALASRPGASRTMNNLAVALAKAGRGANAVERARTWVAAAPADPERLFTLALAQAEQDVDASLATLRQVLAVKPDHALAQHNLALLLKRLDRTEEAIDAARRANATQPRAEAHLVLGALYAQQEAFGPAVTALEAAVTADPRSVDAWMQLGSVHETRGDLSKAADAFRKAIALRPEAWSAYAALATVLRRQGDAAAADRASAQAESRRIRERAEREAVVLTAVGVASLDGGDAETARARFAAALAADDRYAPAHYHLGRALQRLGRTDEARTAFERARELNPALVPP